MKKTNFFIFIIVLLCSFLNAEINFELSNGIPVFIKESEDTGITSVFIVVKGGVKYLTRETSGLENALFNMMSRGSKKYSYADLQQFSFDTQSSISAYSTTDGSVLSMVSLNHYFDKTFDRFIDGFLEPSFSEKEYNNLIIQLNQSLQYKMNEPSSLGAYYANMVIYQDHPYSASTSVLPESIENITLEKLKQHHKLILDSRRIAVVAVGSFNIEKFKNSLETSLGTIQKASYELKDDNVPLVNINQKNLIIANENASNNGYIMRLFRSPEVTSEDYVVARIASAVFSDILYNVVREKNGICYTPGSDILSSNSPFGFEYLIRTSNLTDFSKYLEEARHIMKENKVIAGLNSKKEYIYKDLSEVLEGYINSYINKKYYLQDTTSGIASRMCASLLQFGDINSADLLTQKVKNVTANDVKRVFNKYWIEENSFFIAVVGPEEEDKVVFDY